MFVLDRLYSEARLTLREEEIPAGEPQSLRDALIH